MPDDTFNLQRFVDAQAEVFDRVRAELVAGKKATHWMWYIFPQIDGLGVSAMTDRYAIMSLAEAKAYLAHPVLGPRLVELTGIMNGHAGRGVRDILGRPDDLKFCSCMTLFAEAADDPSIFRQALANFFGGERDSGTLQLLAEGAG